MTNGNLKGRTRLLCGVMAIGLCVLTPVSAAQAKLAMAAENEKGFRAAGVTLHAEGPTAEACVSFTSSLPLDEAAATLAQVQLLSDGQKIALDAKNTRLSGGEICLGNLDFGARYEVRVGRLTSAEGEKLPKSYTYRFAVPHRKASLSFLAFSDMAAFPRLNLADKDTGEQVEIHALRSVNVDRAKLTLYRIEDPELVVPSWQQFVQNARTPSEGLYFARTKGKNVFETELAFTGKPDADQSLSAPLPSDLQNGLYFLAAAPQGKDEKNPALVAGQWFVVSTVRVGAVMTDKGAAVFASDEKGTKPLAGVKVELMTEAGKELAKAVTDAQGIAQIALEPKDRALAALLLARGEGGAIELLDLSRVDGGAIAAPVAQADLGLDQTSYASGGKAIVTLRATDRQGALRPVEKGQLRLLRPDRSLYSQQEIVAPTGVAQLVLALPVAQEADRWTLEWTEKDGAPMASAVFQLKAQGAKGGVVLDAPAYVAAGDKGAVVRVSAQREDGQPMAFASGRLAVRAVRARHDGWTDYRFGLPVDPDAASVRYIPFMADAEGKARVNVRSDAWGPDTMALEIVPTLEGGATGDTRTVKVGARQALVGVKPMQGDRIAPGITVARLGVVALDSDGRKKPVANVNYALIEEGRSFEWYPGDGYWEYKPLPQRRRIAGGPVALGDGEATVQQPLTPGQYTMELTQGDGKVLARVGFVIGPDGTLVGGQDPDDVLQWTKTPEKMESHKAQILPFHLDKDAMVALVAADERVRTVQFKPLKAGNRSLTVEPESDWDQNVRVRVLALTAQQGDPAMIEASARVSDARKTIDVAATLPTGTLVAGKTITIPVRARAEGHGPAHLTLVATPVPTKADQPLEPVMIKDIALDASGKANVALNVPVFDGSLRVAFSAIAGKAYGERVVTVPVARALSLRGRPPEQMAMGDHADVYLTFMNSNGPESVYTYEIKIPEGLAVKGETKGRMVLGRQASQTLAFSLDAKAPVSDKIEMTVRSPAGIEQTYAWPLLVRAGEAQRVEHKTITLAAEAAHDLPALKNGMALMAPVGLPDSTLALLHTLATRAPMTTNELSHWLQAVALWQEPMIRSGLVGTGRLAEVQAERLSQLLRRQNEDGGFSSTRSGRQSDMASTALALRALSGVAEEPSQRAAAWLSQKLQNTWFDEAERPVRALAFEALDAAGRADIAGLRYFAETSRDKDMPVDSVAALALIFARSAHDEDKDKASEWTNRYRKHEDAADWSALVYAAQNRLIATEEWNKIRPADLDPSHETSLDDAAQVLTSFGYESERSGTWRILFDGANVKHYGIVALPAGAHKIKNMAARPLTLSVFEKTGKAAGQPDSLRAAPAVSLRLFTKDGAPLAAGAPLQAGETYVLGVSVTGRVTGEKTMRLTVPVCGAFEARTPPVGAEAQVAEALSGMPFTPDAAIDRSATPEAVRWTFDSTKAWQGVMVLHALERGKFVWPAPLLESEDGERRAAPYEPLRVIVQ